LIELLEKLVGGIGSLMDDWVVVGKLHWNVLAFEELLQMLPIVHLLVQLEAVVILVHLDFCWVVSRTTIYSDCHYIKYILPGKDLCIEPSVAEVPLGVRNFIGQVQTLKPNVQFSRECHHL
jgi:hypothetical protein